MALRLCFACRMLLTSNHQLLTRNWSVLTPAALSSADLLVLGSLRRSLSNFRQCFHANQVLLCALANDEKAITALEPLHLTLSSEIADYTLIYTDAFHSLPQKHLGIWQMLTMHTHRQCPQCSRPLDLNPLLVRPLFSKACPDLQDSLQLDRKTRTGWACLRLLV